MKQPVEAAKWSGRSGAADDRISVLIKNAPESSYRDAGLLFEKFKILNFYRRETCTIL